MIKILELPLEENLAPLYEYMRSQGIPIRIIEASGRQEVWVQDARFRELTLELYERYRQDPQVRASLTDWQDTNREAYAGQGAVQGWGWLLSVSRTPVVWLGLIGLALVTFLQNFYVSEQLLLSLFFADLQVSDYATMHERVALLRQHLADGEFWRLLTPIFLHGGALHLVFNTLWFWYLGVKIERLHGSSRILLLILVTGIGSNFAQYLVSGPAFGGMSGVIYGFFGYVGWYMFRYSRSALFVPPAILIFALVWLVLGYVGFNITPGSAGIANTAHTGGLLLGIFFAATQDTLLGRPRERVA